MLKFDKANSLKLKKEFEFLVRTELKEKMFGNVAIMIFGHFLEKALPLKCQSILCEQILTFLISRIKNCV